MIPALAVSMWSTSRRLGATRLLLPCLAALSLLVLADGLRWRKGWLAIGCVVLMLALSRRSLKRPFFVIAFLLPLHGLHFINPSLYMAAPLLEFLVLGFFIAWFIKVVQGQVEFRGISLDDLPWLPFLVFALGSAVTASAVHLWQLEALPAISPFRTLFEEGSLNAFFPFRALFTFVESFMLYLFVRTSLDRRDLEKLCRVLLGSSLLVLLAGFIVYSRVDFSPRFQGVNRAVATFLGPNDLATYLLMILPLGAWAAAQAQSRKMRVFVLGGLAAGLSLLYLSRSQGAGLALVALLPAAGWLAFPRASLRRLMLLAFVALVLAGAGWTAHKIATLSPWELNALSDGRYFLFLSGGNMVGASPLIGVGLGKFYHYLGGFYPAGIPWRAQHEHAHNMYLQLLAELGVLGFALLFWPLGRLLQRAFRSGEPAPLVSALLVALLGALLHSLTDYTLLLVPLSLLFWIQVGMLQLAQGRNAHISAQAHTE